MSTGRAIPDGTDGESFGTEVPFSKVAVKLSLIGEQFWGRAARVPRDSKEFGALVIFLGKKRRPGAAKTIRFPGF
jgi:hypothetical protein